MHAITDAIEQKLDGHFRHYWADQLYKPIVFELSRRKSVLEIGAGRNPLFSQVEIAAGDIDYTANDLDAGELAAMPEDLNSRAFNASGMVPDDCVSRYDFIFSRMVQEHLPDTLSYYQNLARMLRPGGIALNLHPVFFSLPFLINRHLPESITEPILYLTRRDRSSSISPKFPAVYDRCLVSERVRESIKRQGFGYVWQRPFYGHGYYKFAKPIHILQRAYAKFLWQRKLTPFATFCYTVAIK